MLRVKPARTVLREKTHACRCRLVSENSFMSFPAQRIARRLARAR